MRSPASFGLTTWPFLGQPFQGGLLEVAPNISTSTPMYTTASHSANRGRRTWNSEQSPWTGVERGERKNQKEHRKLGACPQAIPEVYQMHKVLA